MYCNAFHVKRPPLCLPLAFTGPRRSRSSLGRHPRPLASYSGADRPAAGPRAHQGIVPGASSRKSTAGIQPVRAHPHRRAAAAPFGAARTDEPTFPVQWERAGPPAPATRPRGHVYSPKARVRRRAVPRLRVAPARGRPMPSTRASWSGTSSQRGYTRGPERTRRSQRRPAPHLFRRACMEEPTVRAPPRPAPRAPATPGPGHPYSPHGAPARAAEGTHPGSSRAVVPSPAAPASVEGLPRPRQLPAARDHAAYSGAARAVRG